MIFLIAVSAPYQLKAENLTLTYKAHKILALGEMQMMFDTLPDMRYRLTMNIKGNRILKNRTEILSSSGVLDERLHLIAETFIDKKYRVIFDKGRPAKIYRKDILQPTDTASIAAASPILDPISAIWQIMPKLAYNKQHGHGLCDNIAINYFSGKNLYHLRLSETNPLKLHKKHIKLQASHAISCLLHRSKNGQPAEQTRLIIIEASHYPHPLIYQFYNQDAVRFTLHSIDVAS